MITPVPFGTWLYHGDVNMEGMGSRMFQDQRAYERVAMHAQVICIVDSETSRGVSWNLSQAGIQVEVSNLKPKEAIQLSFRLPVSGVAVDAVGSIVWQHNRRHGIRFTHVGPQSRLSILQYVREHKKH
ncbi:MAG TPA: PilZ domain-containing protein [Candidatus Sulfotelmatobacter sp.]|nr:PilZ domain-containing protein [Candidatus Sulfotelmatobacter sp.]